MSSQPSEDSQPSSQHPSSTLSTSSTSSTSKPSTTRLPLPSLNQLAARINTSSSSSSSSNSSLSTTAAPRPRLPTSLLRTGITVPPSTNASTTTLDSIVVNVPSSTRSASPATTLSMSPPRSETPLMVNANESGTGAPPLVGGAAGLGGGGGGGGDPLTEEKLEKLNEETTATQKQSENPITPTQDSSSSTLFGAPGQAQDSSSVKPKQRMPMGYKGVPSLDAITARLVKTRSLSIDGSAKPPEPEQVEDPKTPGLKIKAPEHPLQFSWIIYHDTKPSGPYTPATATTGPPSSTLAPAPSPAPAALLSPSHAPDTSADYEAGLTIIGEFATVESFCRYFNWLKPPSNLERNSNYHFFKSGIKPMWEDPANANGGKWVLTMKNNPSLLDRCWSWLAMALVGEELEEGDDICGAVVSLRSKVDRIQVWTRSKDDVEKLNRIGKKMVKLLDVSEADGIGLEFQYNTEDRPLPNKFLSIHSLPSSTYRSGFQQSPGPGSAGLTPTAATSNANPGASAAFGSFGVGIGGSSWKPTIKRPA